MDPRRTYGATHLVSTGSSVRGDGAVRGNVPARVLMPALASASQACNQVTVLVAGLARTLSAPSRFRLPGPASARTYGADRTGREGWYSARKPQVMRHMAALGQAVCQTVGLAYVGSKGSATTCEIARELGFPGLAGLLVPVPPCFMMCRCEPLRSSGYGHIRTYKLGALILISHFVRGGNSHLGEIRPPRPDSCHLVDRVWPWGL